MTNYLTLGMVIVKTANQRTSSEFPMTTALVYELRFALRADLCRFLVDVDTKDFPSLQ